MWLRYVGNAATTLLLVADPLHVQLDITRHTGIGTERGLNAVFQDGKAVR